MFTDNNIDVLIVGAGPTGLTLATALAARGVRTTVVDRQVAGANTSRAAVVHARTLEVLEAIGVADRLASLGVHAPRFTIRDRDRILALVRFDNLPTRYPYTLMISQAVTEAVLLERLVELGGQVLRPRAVTDLAQDDQCVTATLDDGAQLRARYLVGADGMYSTIRERAGVRFPGGSYGESFSLADVRMTGAAPGDEVILYFSPAGLVVVAPLPGGFHRIVATVDSAPEHPDVDYVQALLDARGPERERAIVKEVVWGSRFRVHHRVVDSYRAGRVLLAGDAAHVHSPAGGQGMNTGIQDAMALAEALSAALASGAEEPLNAYGAIRRPIAKQVVALADRLTRLAIVGGRLRPLRNTLLKFLACVPAFRRRLAWRLSGLAYR
ncbi:MAG TPA: FAD-dependent oxidoreductase [Blastocatellia bacterium]|jgi:2-polyprenyl-6-methoxyphenol hydroxylase-like FAD-dependent oxidoreductase|nr:FAD-dependent oxidoreductase [Blastocatellia bacterium]